MPDRGRDLEQELRDLGSRLEYPPTPDLARTARLRLEAERDENAARRGRFWLPALSPRWAVAAMFVVVLAVPALSPAARDALSGMFVAGGGASSGAGGSVTQSGRDARGNEADQAMSGGAGSQAAPAESGSSIPESAGAGQEANAPESGGEGQAESLYGGDGEEYPKQVERITLQEAEAQAGEDTPLLLPQTPEIGKPDRVFSVPFPSEGSIALVYRARPELPSIGPTGTGMVLTQTPGDLEPTFLQDIPKKKTFEKVKVGGRSGYWMPRSLAYWIPEMRQDAPPARSAGPPESILVWEQGGLSLRLESNLARKEAIRVAESVR